jgi:hypothetical protein
MRGFQLYRLIFIMAFLLPLASYCQSGEWWNKNVKWDGQTHWSRYIRIVPKYMGPNALSVPQINNGSIDSACSIGLTANGHFSNGDNTQNLMLYGNYTTKNNSISIDVQFVPYEQFQMSHEKKTERKTFFVYYDRKRAVGDVVANTTFQVFPKKRDKFQLALRVGLRMPSGSLLSLARYGDVPAYWFDIGSGVPLRNSNWKWISMAGFFAWQTNEATHRQNDAILYGTGFEWNKRYLRIQTYLAGYSGYENNGDKPMVLRFALDKKVNKKVWMFRLQQGLNDFEYFTIEAGARIVLGQ